MYRHVRPLTISSLFVASLGRIATATKSDAVVEKNWPIGSHEFCDLCGCVWTRFRVQLGFVRIIMKAQTQMKGVGVVGRDLGDGAGLAHNDS